MVSIPVGSDEPANAVLQSTFYNDIVSINKRTGVLEKAATDQTAGLVVQTVTNGDIDHAPSGDAVNDFVTNEIVDVLTSTVANGDITHAPTGNAVFDYVEAKVLTGTASLNFPNLVAFAVADLTVTVTGAATGDSVSLGPPAAINAGLLWCGFVSAADTVTVRVYNLTAIAIDPPPQTWRATVSKP
jgi:hypothetical protein